MVNVSGSVRAAIARRRCIAASLGKSMASITDGFAHWRAAGKARAPPFWFDTPTGSDQVSKLYCHNAWEQRKYRGRQRQRQHFKGKPVFLQSEYPLSLHALRTSALLVNPETMQESLDSTLDGTVALWMKGFALILFHPLPDAFQRIPDRRPSLALGA